MTDLRRINLHCNTSGSLTRPSKLIKAPAKGYSEEHKGSEMISSHKSHIPTGAIVLRCCKSYFGMLSIISYFVSSPRNHQLSVYGHWNVRIRMRVAIKPDMSQMYTAVVSCEIVSEARNNLNKISSRLVGQAKRCDCKTANFLMATTFCFEGSVFEWCWLLGLVLRFNKGGKNISHTSFWCAQKETQGQQWQEQPW